MFPSPLKYEEAARRRPRLYYCAFRMAGGRQTVGLLADAGKLVPNAGVMRAIGVYFRASRSSVAKRFSLLAI